MLHIFYMNLNGDCSYEQSLVLYRLLPEERKQKVKSAKHEDVARKRLYTGAFLQYVLSEETGIPMENISYIYGSQGKPAIDYQQLEKLPKNVTYNIERKFSQEFHFNLSHSGKYAVLAVSNAPVGIDIEYKARNYQSLAQRCFCKEEYADIMEAEESQSQKKRFLQYWTIKEAFIKHSGKGLSVPLNSFRIMRRDSGISFLEDSKQWFASLFLGVEPYCISVCSGSEQDVKELIEENKLSNCRLKQISIGNICHNQLT